MITIYTSFRSFKHKVYDKIQRDACDSWVALDPQPQVIVVGDEPGTSDICKKYKFKQIKTVRQSEAETPYVNSMIDLSEQHAVNDTMLLCAGDIIIGQETINIAKAVKKQLKEFCVCARKMHVIKKANGKIKLERWATWQAGDYFLHSKGLFAGMPDFLIGRFLVERWMYRWACNKNGLVDATGIVSVLHQNHPRDFKPANKEVAWNAKIYQENEFPVNKWKNTKYYDRWPDLYGIGISYANWVMRPDYILVDNVDPTDRNWGYEITTEKCPHTGKNIYK